MSKELASRVSSLGNHEIAEILAHIIKESTDERRTFLHNFWTRKVKTLAKKRKKDERTTASNALPQNLIFINPLPSTSKNYAAVQPEDRRENSAKQSAFIFKPEKCWPNNVLFLDVEMVDLIKLPGEKTHSKHPGEIAIVNENGDLILWARVKIAHEKVCNYFTAISGIQPNSLVNATPFHIAKLAIEYLLETAYLVGLNLKSA